MASSHGMSLNFIETKSGMGWVRFQDQIITISPYINLFASRQLFSRRQQGTEELASLLAGIHMTLRGLPAADMYSFLLYPPTSKCTAFEKLSHDICHSLSSSATSVFEHGKFIHEFFRPEAQWIHGDFRPQNIGYQSDKSKLLAIDFDNTSFFPRVYEVARGYLCCAPSLRQPFASLEFERFIDSYNEVYYLNFNTREIFSYYIYIAICSIASRNLQSERVSGYDKIIYHRCLSALNIIK